MWYIQWNWNKNFLYKSKGAEEARAASCVRHLQGKEAGLSHSRAACAGRVRCWHSCWYDSEGMTGARGTEGHPSVRNMTWPFLWDTSSSPVKWRTSPNSKCEGISWGQWTELCIQVSDVGWDFKACTFLKSKVRSTGTWRVGKSDGTWSCSG